MPFSIPLSRSTEIVLLGFFGELVSISPLRSTEVNAIEKRENSVLITLSWAFKPGLNARLGLKQPHPISEHNGASHFQNVTKIAPKS